MENSNNYPQKKIKHLEFIQSVISRMARCSFAIKGWTISLIVGVFVFLKMETLQEHMLCLYCIIAAFYVLDSYYLYQEKRFRDGYNDVRKLDEDNIDFDMHFQNEVDIFRALVSPAEWGFYLPLAFFLHLLVNVK